MLLLALLRWEWKTFRCNRRGHRPVIAERFTYCTDCGKTLPSRGLA